MFGMFGQLRKYMCEFSSAMTTDNIHTLDRTFFICKHFPIGFHGKLGPRRNFAVLQPAHRFCLFGEWLLGAFQWPPWAFSYAKWQLRSGTNHMLFLLCPVKFIF